MTPYYADSTPTHGWLHQVTGQVQIIPATAHGQALHEGLPSSELITINGPTFGDDLTEDAAIGMSVSCAGDTNGDGIDDLLFGSHTLAAAWVIYGGSTLSGVDLDHLDASHGWMVTLPRLGSGASHVRGIGDINDDGLDDIAFVVPNSAYAVGDTTTTRGSAFIVSGTTQARDVDLSSLDTSASGLLARIDTPEGHTATTFSRVGDLNGDGVTDFVLSDFNTPTASNALPGFSWVIDGSAIASTPHLDIATAGVIFTMTTPQDGLARLGAAGAVADLGDINGDGMDDLVIGFDGASIQPGGVAIVLGSSSSDPVMIDPSGDSTNERVRVVVGDPGTSMGWAVDALIRPGSPSLIAVGAWNEGNGDGAAYLLSSTSFSKPFQKLSQTSPLVRLASPGIAARFGRSITFAGDFLGVPTLAIGGDGVIDDEANDRQGYAHSATLVAVSLASLGLDESAQRPPAQAQPTASSPTSQVPTTASSIDKQAQASSRALARTGATITSGLMALALTALGSMILARRRSTLRR